jgi:hypothetical protein
LRHAKSLAAMVVGARTGSGRPYGAADFPLLQLDQCLLGSVPGRRNHFDAGAVASCLKQREAKSVFLGAEYSAYQSFLVFRDPIASAVLGHLEMVRGPHCRRRKAGHV